MTQPRHAARAIADVTSGTILASVEIAASPERVFRAITTPQELVQWWGSETAYRTTKWEADVRVNGRWRAEGLSADGSPYSVEGEFVEIDPPRRVVQTWKPSWDEGATTRLCYVLEPIDGGTRLIVRHEGFGDRQASCRNHGSGWSLVLGWLSAYVAPRAESVFLCRLIPPRPSFAFDMSADERAIMQAHAVYWQAQLRLGKVIVVGPVHDPAGPWGLGVVRARDLADVQALGAADPAIQSGHGFRYEYMPLLSALLPE